MADINQVRDMLPGVHDTVYLNTGTCGPLPTISFEAMQEELRTDLTKARIDQSHFPKIGESRLAVREAVAAAVKADPSEIAITASTTDGMYVAIISIAPSPKSRRSADRGRRPSRTFAACSTTARSTPSSSSHPITGMRFRRYGRSKPARTRSWRSTGSSSAS